MLSLTYRARYMIERAVLPRLFNKKRRDDLRRLGTVYGGYYVPMALLSSSSVCYSAGVGEDV